MNDAMSGVDDLADEAAAKGYPALGITDHGNPAGLVQGYKACRRHGMEFLPGVELYVAADRERKIQGHNLHLTVNAYTTKGYRNLCKLVTLTAKNYFYKPVVDFGDFAQMAEEGLTEGLSIGTGCWFGVLPTIIRQRGTDEAVAMAKALAGWFPRVYIELQNHGIEQHRGDAAWIVAGETLQEEHMVAELLEVAEMASLPYIVTTDAHYTTAADQELHDSLKQLCSWSDDPDDAMFPGEAYCLRSGKEMGQFFEPDVLATAIDNLTDLAEHAHVRIPELEKFRMLIPDVTHGGDPDEQLKLRCIAGMNKLVKNASPAMRKKYQNRMMSEIDTVIETKMAGYLLLVSDLCVWMRSENIVFNTRGSANDFLLCWLLEITLVDSVKWNLRPERFISADRIKPADIDLDVENQRRKEIEVYLGTRFNICQIGTIMKYKLFSEDGEGEEESGRGSLRVRYDMVMGKRGIRYDHWRDVPYDHQKTLFALSDKRLISGYGTHPAGLIVAPDQALIAELPMVRIGAGANAHLVTAYGKDDVEDLGFIKLDVLGLKTLTAVRIACLLIDPTTPAMDFLETIPLNDEAVYKEIAAGRTESVFQLAQPAAQNFVNRMKPTKIGDIVAAMALFRPAARKSGVTDAYLDRRAKRESIPIMHADLIAETANTYGVLLYQEQVIGCLRAIRMDMAELNTLLKAVKASNDYVAGAKVAIAQAMPRIRQLAGARGWSERDVEFLVEAVDGYADYGFNEAHAVAYGLLAYRTAWLCKHYPVQWWTGMLTAYTGEKKEDPYRRVAIRQGVKIGGPHVNRSGVSYTYDPERNVVRKGLQSIDGVGPVAAEELVANAPYTSLMDLGKRVNSRRVPGATALALGKERALWVGVIDKLDANGALEGLE